MGEWMHVCMDGRPDGRMHGGDVYSWHSCGSGRNMCYTGTGRVLASRAVDRGGAPIAIRIPLFVVPIEFRIYAL